MHSSSTINAHDYVEKFRIFLLHIAAVTIPLFYLPLSPQDPFQVPKEVLLSFWACLAFIALFYPAKRLFQDSIGNLYLVSALFLAFIALSIPGSANYMVGLMELKQWACLIILFLTAARINWSIGRLQAFMITSIIVGAIVGISVILEYFEMMPLFQKYTPKMCYSFEHSNRRLFSFLGYQNIIAQYLIFMIVPGIGLLLTSTKWITRTLALVCTMIIGAALVLTFCRGGIIAAVIGLCVFIILYKYMRKDGNFIKKPRVLLIVLFCIIALIAAVVLLGDSFEWQIAHFLEKTVDRILFMFERVDSDRSILWKDSISMIWSQPINGVGLGNFSIMYQLFKTGSWPNITFHAHNEYLHMMAETGVVGLIGSIVFLFTVISLARKKYAGAKRQDEKLLLLTIACSCIITLLHSILSYNLHSAASAYFFFVGLGILCSNTFSVKEKDPSLKKDLIINSIVTTCALIVALYGIYGEYKVIMGHYHLGKGELAMKRYNENSGISHFKKAIEYQPYNFKPYVLISRIFQRNEDKSLAQSYRQKAQELSPYIYYHSGTAKKAAKKAPKETAELNNQKTVKKATETLSESENELLIAQKKDRKPGEMVFVQGGCYEMGCGSWTSDCELDESPVHEVCVNDFQIDKYEVTQSEYMKIMKKNPSKFKGDDMPVDSVQWFDANNYCNGVGKRLPTEAEWEYAARSRGKKEKYAGTSSESLLDEYAWVWVIGRKKISHPVGEKKPNGLGIYDMNGNVWEWVSDMYIEDYYKTSPRLNPEGPSIGTKRAGYGGIFRSRRGGGWSEVSKNIRISNRGLSRAGNRCDNTGFRCAISK